MPIIRRVDNIPTEKHYAIITDVTVGIDNGYGDINHEQYSVYEVYSVKQEWQDEVIARTKYPRRDQPSFRALVVEPAKIEINVEVK